MVDREPQIEAYLKTGYMNEYHKQQRKWVRLTLMGSLPLAPLVGGGIYWHSLQGQVATDNAYVHLDKVSISAEISGRIVEVAVALAMPIKGWLADRVGSRRLFICSVAGFELSSMLCGLAQN
jgi:hypothetical protein